MMRFRAHIAGSGSPHPHRRALLAVGAKSPFAWAARPRAGEMLLVQPWDPEGALLLHLVLFHHLVVLFHAVFPHGVLLHLTGRHAALFHLVLAHRVLFLLGEAAGCKQKARNGEG